jgi:hypothetical protein
MKMASACVPQSGSRASFLRYDALGHFAQLAVQGRFTVPVARTFGPEDWREALDLSLNRRAHGKLVLLLDGAASAN